MKRNRAATMAAVALLAVMIFDAKTALSGAAEGVQLCVSTVIPSLFPFFVVCTFLTGLLGGRDFTAAALPEKLLRIPHGSFSLLLLGFLGGYPVGAQCLSSAYERGELSREDAERMLAFCSNAGPAFLFGIGASLFPDRGMCFLLWAIHIAAALLVALFTRGSFCAATSRQTPQKAPTLSDAMRASLRAMALVCGWIVALRTLIAFAERWFLWLLPRNLQLLMIGLTELSNGCCGLAEISSIGLRTELFSLFIGFGGLCVALQTRSVIGTLSLRNYFPGKLAQGALSFLACVLLQPLLEDDAFIPPLWTLAAALIVLLGSFLFLHRSKKCSSNLRPLGV